MLDFQDIANGVTVSAEADLPRSAPPARRSAVPNPFLDVVRDAASDGKRRDLPGRFSITPYEGRKNACEAYTVQGKLHAAARELGVKVHVRRVDPSETDTGFAFKVDAPAATATPAVASKGGTR